MPNHREGRATGVASGFHIPPLRQSREHYRRNIPTPHGTTTRARAVPHVRANPSSALKAPSAANHTILLKSSLELRLEHWSSIRS